MFIHDHLNYILYVVPAFLNTVVGSKRIMRFYENLPFFGIKDMIIVLDKEYKDWPSRDVIWCIKRS